MRSITSLSRLFKLSQNLFLAIIAIAFLICSNASAYEVNDLKIHTVRIGYRQINGYQMMDKNGNRSGYGYELFQYMKMYSPWRYEYVGYDLGSNELLARLADGSIDILATVMKTPEREKIFAFSKEPVSVSAVNLVVRSGSPLPCTPGVYGSYNGIKVGAIDGAAYIKSFKNFAAIKGFSYKMSLFRTAEQLEHALLKGTVDAIITSNVTIVDNSRAIDEFDVKKVYIATRRSDRRLIGEVDSALEQVRINYPGLLDELHSKYYSVKNDGTITFTPAERAFLEECRKYGRRFTAVADPSRRPPVSFFNGKRQSGIIGDITEEIFRRAGISVDMLRPKSHLEYIKILREGRVDICADMRRDFNYAEGLGFTLTSPYYETTVSRITRRNFTGRAKSLAVAEDSDIASDYVPTYAPDESAHYYKNLAECINAVTRGECDAAYLYTPAAQYAVYNDEKNRIVEAAMPLYKVNLCLAVRDDANTLLTSILNKAADSLTNGDIMRLTRPYTVYTPGTLSFMGYMYNYPIRFTLLVSVFIILSASVLVLLMLHKRRNRENQLILERQIAIQSAGQRERRLAAVTKREYDFQTLVNLDDMSFATTDFSGNIPPVIPVSGDYSRSFAEFFAASLLPEFLDEVTAVLAPESLRSAYEDKAKAHASLKYCIQYDGREIWISSTLYFYHDEGARFASIMHKDVTEEVEKSRSAAIHDSALQAIANYFLAIYVISSGDNKALTLKSPRGVEEMFLPEGSNFFEMMEKYRLARVAKNSMEAFSSFFSINKICEELKAGEAPELTYLDSDGMWITVKVFSGTGNYPSRDVTIWAYMNASEKARMQERLRAALSEARHANAAKSVFLSNMSHDMRTPMNAIIGLSGLAHESATLAEAVGYIDQINESGKHLLALINDTLDMNSIESGKITLIAEPYSMEEFCQTMRSLMEPKAREKGIKLSISCATSSVLLLDPLRFNQIFVNLLTNALKFTGRGGHVSLEVLPIGEDNNGLRRFSIVVKDDGIGMSREFQNVMYDSFEQENNSRTVGESGTGLGLSIVKRLVGLMGADLCCDSQRGKGTTFKIDFSAEVVKAAPTKRTEDTVCDILRLNGRRVLLADDHPLNVQVARKLLEKQGVAVDCVEDGKAAVDKFIASALGYYDAILMDIRMPVMNGLEASRAIRGSGRGDASVAIIAMTANAYDEDRKKSHEAGMDCHLTKPFNPAELYAVLAKILAEKEDER